MTRGPVRIVGGGLAGPLLAILCARRGFAVSLYERRADPRSGVPDQGRSINLALAARGIAALDAAGIMPRVRPLMIPMRGRLVHEPGRTPSLLPYGQRAHEVIYSIGRAALNRVLIEEAARAGVRLHFHHTCTGVSAASGTLELIEEPGGRRHQSRGGPIIASDGAGSAVRTSLEMSTGVSVREELLDHDYKELGIPARAGGIPALDPNALHIWPRHGFMLIALPNTDGSFTATLFLPRHGPQSFEELETPAMVAGFFAREFPDALPLMPALLAEFAAHPQGRLGTVHVAPWHVGEVLLLGDAAHAIVPFHGQGMNAAFEDCSALDALLGTEAGWTERFARFEAERRPNTEAIARMAIENYGEMRAQVLEEKFLRDKALALELEKRFPQRFIPRYSMVMFHPEISYAEALRRGTVQQEILDVLDARSGPKGEADFALAQRLIEERL